MRQEVYSFSCVVMIVFIVLSLASLALLNLSKDAKEDSKKVYQVICMEFSFSTVLLIVFMALATCKVRFIDFFGFSILFPLVVVGTTFYLSPSMHLKDGGPNYQMYMFCLIYATNMFYMTTDYLFTMLVRQVLGWIFLGCSIFIWKRDHQFNVAMNVITNVAIIAFAEAGTYASTRSKALLFKRVKVMSTQEKQLSNLLDSVPDKVLICTRAEEARAPKCIYSNR